MIILIIYNKGNKFDYNILLITFIYFYSVTIDALDGFISVIF